MNPILPRNYYIPDVEARQWSDGKVYLYGSSDCCGKMDYCSHIYHVFSSYDMNTWEDRGISFTGYEDGENCAFEPGILYAPDCIYLDGKYYLFYCQDNGAEGVAISANPEGPFTNARPVKNANKTQIDPAVFEDDDGTVYYYWGQWSAKAGILNASRDEVVKESIIDGILTESEHGFHEGISMRKRNGIYYMVYTDISRGRATCIGYATSQSPMGPFIKRGIIIDNTGCDPESWNNHGSIAEINGQWYVFYHRSTHNSKYSRRVCVEPIFFDENGLIQEVEMTTQGVEGPLSSMQKIEAADTCIMNGSIYINSVNNGTNFYEYLGHIKKNDWAAYKYLKFSGKEEFFEVECEGKGECIICVSLDKKCQDKIAFGKVGVGKNRLKLERKIKGNHALYLHFQNDAEELRIRSFYFTGVGQTLKLLT